MGHVVWHARLLLSASRSPPRPNGCLEKGGGKLAIEPRWVLGISSDEDDRMGAKIKTQKNP